MPRSPSPFTAPVRIALRNQVSALFNDASKGEAPVKRRADALFPPDSVTWRVHGDVVTMMIGGVTSLLLQMLHPAAMAGVWDHSDFRHNMMGRLRATAKFIARTTYDHADDAREVLARVRHIHGFIRGALEDGTPYEANDPELLAWVHAAETWSFLAAWARYGEPEMSAADKDRYFAEMTLIGRELGADPVPDSLATTEAFIDAMRPQLRADHRSREVCRMVLNQRVGPLVTEPASKVLMAAAVDLLPDWARDMHGLKAPRLTAPAVRASAFAMTETLRWAYADSPNVRVHAD